MPKYTVIKPGFYKGDYYDPNGKRPVLVTDKPFEKKEMPSWVVPFKEKSDAVKAKEAAQEASRKAAEEQSTQQQVAEASSIGDGAEASFLDKVKNAVTGKSEDDSGNVETL